MSPDERNVERFSRALDDAWLRERLKSAMAESIGTEDEEALLHALSAADPLGETSPRRTWRAAIREMLASWPNRLAFAGAVCALLLVGVVVGRSLNGPGDVRVVADGIPPKPVYDAARAGGGPALGIGPSVKPESERKFREAMAYYTSSDFPVKALPLLREAVAADRRNDQAQFWLGVVLLMTDKPAEAVAPLEEATQLAPASLQYKQYLLFAYLRTGAVKKALAVQVDLLKPR